VIPFVMTPLSMPPPRHARARPDAAAVSTTLGRAVVALGGAAAAVVFLGAVLVLLNQPAAPPTSEPLRAVNFATAPPPPPKKREQPVQQQKPKPAPQKKSAAPPAAARLSGLAFDLPGFSDAQGVVDATSLTGHQGAAVMTEETADDPPRPLSRPAPRYPPRAQRDGVTGRVVLHVKVTAEGDVSQVVVLESQPPGVFDEAATDAVRAWRFEPARYQGKAVAAWVRQPLSFSLQ
jgi:protein TonB